MIILFFKTIKKGFKNPFIKSLKIHKISLQKNLKKKEKIFPFFEKKIYKHTH
jgi:hypothetical protein